MVWLYFLIFGLSFLAMFYSSSWLMNSLAKIGKFLGWKEFVVAFLFFAVSTSFPNLFVGIVSAFNKVPQLSLGDVVGGNIIDMTLIAGIATLLSRAGISAPSRTVQNSAVFLILITLFFVFLVQDNLISRGDGIILLLLFFCYLIWLFMKKERFKKVYDSIEEINFKFFLQNLFLFFFSLILILVAAQGVVFCAKFFANFFNFPIWLIGLLIVSFGNCLPEFFFSIQCAKCNQDWLILGDLIGSVIVCMTLVLGVVALIHPIKIENLSAILTSRFFLLISALFFIFFLRSGKKITKREGVFLILLFIIFLIFEVFLR